MAKKFRFGPLLLTSTYTTNILNPGTTTGGVNATAAPYDKTRITIRHLRIHNVTGTQQTFRLYIDATGGNTAGKQIAMDVPVAGNSHWEYWGGPLVLDTGDFLVGGASAANALVIHGEGEVDIT